jgi:hypothetical protein
MDAELHNKKGKGGDIENARNTMQQLRGTVKQVYLFFPGTLGFSKR